MKRLAVSVAVIGALGVMVGAGLLILRPKPSEYPEPRFPAYLRPPQSPDDLMPSARLAVRQTGGRTPLGLVKSGQRALAVLPDDQDMTLWEAVKRAWEERNVRADAVFSHQIRGLTREELEQERRELASYRVTGGEGWKEIGTFRREIAAYLPADVQKAVVPPARRGIRDQDATKRYLDEHPEYDAVFGGGGGRGTWRDALGRHSPKFLGNWTYSSYTDLLSKVPEFPGDVWRLAEEKLLEPVPFIAQVRATDPEGTDLRFSVTADEARIWREQMYQQGHIFIHPRPPVFANAQGIIAGCSNHTAYFPCMKVEIDKGMIRRIEGGGQFGDLTRTLLAKPELKDARYPTAPYPGYWYLWEMALGTSPKYFRPIGPLYDGGPTLVNAFERNRAGVVHFGFGFESSDERDAEYARTHGVPDRHAWHIHIYFLNYQAQLRDTGEWVTLANGGQMAAFTNPEVRALASRYGDPDLILRHEWVPAIPGVNAPGNYERDYAGDPWAYIKREIEEIRKGTYQYLLPSYPTPKGLEVGGADGR